MALLVVVCVAISAWKILTLRRAEEQLRSAGFFVSSGSPFVEQVRYDWKRAFDPEFLLDRDAWSIPPTIEVEDADKCAQLRNFDALAWALRRLQPVGIVLANCSALENLDGLKGCKGVKRFEIGHCPKLTNADGLDGFTSIELLWISDCPAVPTIGILTRLDRLTMLQELTLWGRSELKNADDLKSLSRLQCVEFRNCDALENVDALASVPGLNYVTLENCQKLSAQSVARLRAAHPNSAIDGP